MFERVVKRDVRMYIFLLESPLGETIEGEKLVKRVGIRGVPRRDEKNCLKSHG